MHKPCTLWVRKSVRFIRSDRFDKYNDYAYSKWSFSDEKMIGWVGWRRPTFKRYSARLVLYKPALYRDEDLKMPHSGPFTRLVYRPTMTVLALVLIGHYAPSPWPTGPMQATIGQLAQALRFHYCPSIRNLLTESELLESAIAVCSKHHKRP